MLSTDVAARGLDFPNIDWVRQVIFTVLDELGVSEQKETPSLLSFHQKKRDF